MSGAAEQVEGIFKNYGSSGLLVLLTVGMEELAAFLIFECPCNSGNTDNFVYGMSYLLGPAIILFLIGLAYQVRGRGLSFGLYLDLGALFRVSFGN